MWYTTMLMVPVLLGQVARQPDGAAAAKEVLRNHCLECHGGASIQAGLKVLEHDSLIAKAKVVVPARPGESELLRRVAAQDDTAMPPLGRRRLEAAEVATLRDWIEAGAADFPSDVPRPDREPSLPAAASGDAQVAAEILADVQKLKSEECRFTRYFTLRHLAAGGATLQHLQLQRAALAKVVNHLSREPRIATLRAIDAHETIFALDIRQVGWQQEPLRTVKVGEASPGLDLFDLALLEYPYGIVEEDSTLFRNLERDYLIPAGLCRPIAAVRGDWFTCIATQPPLYDDFLQLPRTLKELERDLGIDSDANVASGAAHRAGFAVSGVSRNGRVVERHRTNEGAYWKSFDFSSNQGAENFFSDPIRLHPFGGEMIFNLPNGLQGYLIVGSKGDRLSAAPTSVVVDALADDATVRNGLSCMRCHKQGIKRFSDDVRPLVADLRGGAGISKEQVLRLYATQDEMDKLCEEDIRRFQEAQQKFVDPVPELEPITVVAERFLETPLGITAAAGELGVTDQAGLKEVFRTRSFVGLGLVPLANGRVVRRDHWEGLYGRIAQELGIGSPIPPVDGLTRKDLVSAASTEFELRTNHANNLFLAGDELVVTAENRSGKPLHIELAGIDAAGKIVLLTPQPQEVTGGKSLRHPPQGAIRIRSQLGTETILAFASEQPFPPGTVLRGERSHDRIVHFVGEGTKVLQAAGDLSKLSKRSLTIETR